MTLSFTVPGDDIDLAGQASTEIKRLLLSLGVKAEAIRRTVVAMYEGEMNIAIHAGGGSIEVNVDESCIKIDLIDHGPGIDNIELAMQEGWSSAPEWVRERGFGAGMGLPNMQRNSDVFWIESTAGQGTTVHLTINFEQAKQ